MGLKALEDLLLYFSGRFINLYERKIEFGDVLNLRSHRGDNKIPRRSKQPDIDKKS